MGPSRLRRIQSTHIPRGTRGGSTGLSNGSDRHTNAAQRGPRDRRSLRRASRDRHRRHSGAIRGRTCRASQPARVRRRSSRLGDRYRRRRARHRDVGSRFGGRSDRMRPRSLSRIALTDRRPGSHADQIRGARDDSRNQTLPGSASAICTPSVSESSGDASLNLAAVAPSRTISRCRPAARPTRWEMTTMCAPRWCRSRGRSAARLDPQQRL
jgi:hypothetical protein